MAGLVTSVSWNQNGAPYIRVYNSNGSQVTEECYNGGGNWVKGYNFGSGTTVGATSWVDNNGKLHIRLYIGSGQDAPITEQCWDEGGNGWYVGAFKANGDGAAPTSWYVNGVSYIRVYVRSNNGNVSEYCWSGSGWYTGTYPN
jgi:hypothetical protein